MDSLGWLQWQQDDYAGSLEIHEKLLESRLAELGPEHALTAFSQHNTALALASLGRIKKPKC